MTGKKHPKISVILIDGSYRLRFAAVDTLAQQTFPEQAYELLWIEFYDNVKNELRQKEAEYPNFTIHTLNLTGIYHSSFCFNAGIKYAKGELLVITDADVVFGEDFLETIWQEHQNNEKLVMYIYRYDEPKRSQCQSWSWEELEKTCILTNPINYGGCLVVKKKWLLAINGYEQHDVFFTGAHANGRDIATRLKNLGLHIMWHPELKIYHPWHPHKVGIHDPYRRQRIIIKHRALHREIYPYQGIDPNLNRRFPKILEKELIAAKRDLPYYFIRILKFILRKIQYYLSGSQFLFF